ncbi:MAG: TolC family protein [Bacteroidales bacterium]
MKALYTAAVALLLSVTTSAQINDDLSSQQGNDSYITIEKCYQKARSYYPLSKKYNLIALSEKYSLANASTAYIPQLSISAGATYQSEVITLPIDIPGFDSPKIDKDQYSSSLEIAQLIWDGGATNSRKQNIRAQSEVARKEFEVDMYALHERINNIYFGILLLDEQIKQLDIMIDEIRDMYNKVENCINNGVANNSDLDMVEVEIVTANQNRIKLESFKKAYLDMLSLLVGEKITSSSRLIKPAIPKISNNNNRPELALFEAKIKELESGKGFINAKNLPSIGLFVRGSYGKPGFNPFNNELTTYAIGGVKFSWNIGTLFTRKNEIRTIEIGKKNVDIAAEAFLFNNNLAATQQLAEIEKYQKIMCDDDKIIILRERIRKAAKAELENGTISTSDYIRELSKEEIAKQEKILHEIELLKSFYQLKTTLNN